MILAHSKEIRKTQGLFESKIILVTGAASGVGREAAFLYAAQGAYVIVSDVSENKTLQEIRANGGEGAFIKSDVTNPSGCKQLVKQAFSIYKRIDIAFNTAGTIGKVIQLDYTALEGSANVISANINGVFYCMKYELEVMLTQESGVIINVTSLIGTLAFPSVHGCFSGEYGTVGIRESNTSQNSEKGIRINCLAPTLLHCSPGMVNAKRKNSSGNSAKQGKKTNEAIAEMAVWLSSGKASFKTGNHFPEYGGYIAN